MNIKREIEASVINHLLALSLCQCHYTRAHTHTGTENTYTRVFISDAHMFLCCVEWRNSETNTLHDAITEMSHKWHAIIKVSVCMCV